MARSSITSEISLESLPTLSQAAYSLSTLSSGLLYGIMLGLINFVLLTSSVTPYEIVYAYSAITTLFMFFYFLISGVYILDLEHSQRKPVIIRGILAFLGTILLFASFKRLESISTSMAV